MGWIVGSAARTCLGDGEQTFTALVAGRTGVARLPFTDADAVNVDHGYPVPSGGGAEESYRAGGWLRDVVAEAMAAAGLDPDHGRVPVLVGTGLRELRAVERWAVDDEPVDLYRLHFATAVRQAGRAFGPVITLAGACSASGHALALAQDMVDSGYAEYVVAAGADAMTTSMLAMIGRVAAERTTLVRPFDAARTGVLLGEGAAAVVVSATRGRSPSAELLATGLSCDAHHETAPSQAGIVRAMRDAFARAGGSPAEVDLIVAHGTGTALNDAAESAAIGEVFGATPPSVTGVKGAVGHTSGAAALVNVDVALRAMRSAVVPPVVGLRQPLDEGANLPFVRDGAQRRAVRTVQVNAFGFGGVNAVTLMRAAEGPG